MSSTSFRLSPIEQSEQIKANENKYISSIQEEFIKRFKTFCTTKELIINEFLCDESPSVGLPKVEYIEIYNKSSKYFNLNGFKISDGSSDGTIGNKCKQRQRQRP